jgi:hypothetical protein
MPPPRNLQDAQLASYIETPGSTGVGNPTAQRVVLYDATGNTLSVAAGLPVNIEGQKATYSAALINIAPPASAVDTFTITGGASKVVRINRIELSGTQTTGGVVSVSLVLRSTANTGGTSTAAGAVPHDSSSAAAVATVLGYTAVPGTQGTFVNFVRGTKLWVPATTAQPQVLIWDFANRTGQAIVLRGTGQVLAVNFNGTTITGGSFNFAVEWTEES